jgi:thiol-disulfide isomerase/thioredoxin
MKSRVVQPPKLKPGKVIELKDEAVVRRVLADPAKAMVFVYAEGCGWCHKMAPVFDVLAGDASANGVALFKVNSNLIQSFLQEKGVNGFPTFLSTFGEKKYVGYKPLEAMQAILTSTEEVTPQPAARCAIHGAHAPSSHEKPASGRERVRS